MGHNQFRNVPCAYCGNNIAQANRPPGEAMHKRCRTLRHNPPGFVSSGSRKKRTEMVPCAWCGHLRERRAGRKEAPVCSNQCRAAWKNYLANDVYASSWPPAQKRYQSCRVTFIACEWCKSLFASRNDRTFCSRNCSVSYTYANRTFDQKRCPVWYYRCQNCGVFYCARSVRQKRCDPCRALVRYEAKVFGAKAANLLPYIGWRDKWFCQICHRRVKSHTYDHSDQMSPTVDHIVPQSEARTLGWTEDQINDLANLRLAHALCNSDRSNKGGNEQLMLVG